jgi:hypothetical protein
LLLKAAAENNVTIVFLASHGTHDLQPLDKCYFGPLKSHFKNEVAAWMKQNHMARLSGFA